MTALAVAEYIADTWSDPTGIQTELGFFASGSSDLMDQAILREVGDSVSITETLTGIMSAYRIHRVHLRMEPGKQLYCDWLLQRILVENYWQLDSATYSQLDTSTILAPL